MQHDVFISYSSIYKNAADNVYSILEQNGIRCWIAPRDITPGVSFADMKVISRTSSMRYRIAGDIKQAIDWLEKAYEDRDGNLPYIGREIWAPMRNEPRFQELLRRMNLPY